MARSKPKAPCQPATLGGGFFGLPKRVVESPAYRSLSVHARAVLIEIGIRMDGYNNGKIGACQRSIREALGCSPRKVVQAVAELMERGFLDVVVEGRWTEKMAREYRLTFVSTPRAPATNDYLHWSPAEKSSATDAVTGRPHSATDAVTGRRKSVTDAVTARIKNRQKSVGSIHSAATDEVAHIIKPFPSPERGGRDDAETPSKQAQNTSGPSVSICNASDLSPATRAMAARLGLARVQEDRGN